MLEWDGSIGSGVGGLEAETAAPCGFPDVGDRRFRHPGRGSPALSGILTPPTGCPPRPRGTLLPMKPRPSHPRPVRVPSALHRRLAELAEAREPVVVVTVAATGGSPPGKAGAKMLVTADGHEGTVGGGKVEATALEHARRLLGADTGPEILKVDVVRDLGMSCGGTMTLLLEPHTPPPRLVIFGAGHIAEALCHLAAWAGFDVTVCDAREEWVTGERLPEARERIHAPWEEAVERAHPDARSFLVCVTPGHAFDREVVRAVLARVEAPRYLGVVGSRRKAALFRKDLEDAGVPAETAAAIHIPMGLPIGAADPREIALSITAELVATLRGAAS